MTLLHSRPDPLWITGVGYQLTTHVHQKRDVYSTCQTPSTSRLINHHHASFNLWPGISSFAGRPLTPLIFYLLNGHHRRSSSFSGSWGLRLNYHSPRTSLQAGVHLRWCPHSPHSRTQVRGWSLTTLTPDVVDVGSLDDVVMLRCFSGILSRGRILTEGHPRR